MHLHALPLLVALSLLAALPPLHAVQIPRVHPNPLHRPIDSTKPTDTRHVPLKLSAPPLITAPLTPPNGFSITQKAIVDMAEQYYAPMRKGTPHVDCKPVSQQQPHHVVCQLPRTQLLTIDGTALSQVVAFMQLKYPDNGPEGGMTATSYFPQPGFAQNGQVRFEDGVTNTAMFWTLEHGEGCLQATPNLWCVTMAVQAPDATANMKEIVTQPAPPQQQVAKQANQNMAMFEAKATTEIQERKDELQQAKQTTEDGAEREDDAVEQGDVRKPSEDMRFADELTSTGAPVNLHRRADVWVEDVSRDIHAM